MRSRLRTQSSVLVLGLTAMLSCRQLPGQQLPGRQQEPGTDLAALRRKPTAEPKYEGKPRYLLIALGQPVHRVVWCVLDGTTLYVDRDGDGRLDAASERFTPKIEMVKDHFVAESHTYDIGALPRAGDSPAYPGLVLTSHMWNLDYVPRPDLVEVMQVLRTNPSLRNPTVELKREGKPKQIAMTEFADTPAAATVLHFDAPTTWGVVENLVPDRLTAGQQHNFQVSLGTPGLGPWSFVYTFSETRRGLRPEIDVVFGAGPGKQGHWVLPEWC